MRTIVIPYNGLESTRMSPCAGDAAVRQAVRRYFEVVLYLLLFTGFLALASTGRVDLPTVLAVGSALLYRGYLLVRRRQRILSPRSTNVLTLACMAFYVVDLAFVSRAFLGATVHLVLFVMLVRVFSAQRDRDHYFLAVLSFLMVLASAVLTVDSTFLLALAGFILVAVAALILVEMMRSLEKAPVVAAESGVDRPYRRLWFAVAGMAPVLLVFILMGGTAIFFFLPRISAGFLTSAAGSNEITTAFSERVDLGEIGQIQQSKAVVMHVRIDGDTLGGSPLKLRGIAFNHFDGHTWSNSGPRRRLGRGWDGNFGLEAGRTSPAGGLHYRVTLEPFLSDVFFLLARARLLNGNYRAIEEDSEGDVFDVDSEHPIGRYEAESETRRNTGPAWAAPDRSPPPVLPYYLQVPPLDARIRLLAEEVTAGRATAELRARAIESYLRTHYGYTLRLPSSRPADPIADFLFTRRQGHCEYFASAMTIMLRTIGIPSRLVNGFSGGEFNDITSEYLVRASNAHTWVEAYIPGEGWLAFDPTPAGAAPSRSSWGHLALYVDALASFWREWVVNYDLGHQLGLGQDATRASRAAAIEAQLWGRRAYQRILDWTRREPGQLGPAAVKWGRWTAAAAMLLVAVFAMPRLVLAARKVRVARRPGRSPHEAASIWYGRMLKQTAKRGWQKTPAQTPEEFALSIQDPGLQRQISRFTERYERARFGNSAEDALELPRLYDRIRSGR